MTKLVDYKEFSDIHHKAFLRKERAFKRAMSSASMATYTALRETAIKDFRATMDSITLGGKEAEK